MSKGSSFLLATTMLLTGAVAGYLYANGIFSNVGRSHSDHCCDDEDDFYDDAEEACMYGDEEDMPF